MTNAETAVSGDRRSFVYCSPRHHRKSESPAYHCQASEIRRLCRGINEVAPQSRKSEQGEELTMAEEIEENIYDRVRRLGHELSQALEEYDEGKWKAMIFPENRGLGYPVMFAVIDGIDEITASPKNQLQHHLKGVQRAMMRIDPTCTEWSTMNPVDDDDTFRFSFSGSRKAVRS
jgi:hypothetical protein